MSRLLRSLREREEGCPSARPARQLERSPPSRLVYSVRSVVDKCGEILAGCSLLGFVKGCGDSPGTPHSHLLAFKRVVEVEERDHFDTATWAHYWLQVWRFAGEVPLLKAFQVRLFVSGTDRGRAGGGEEEEEEEDENGGRGGGGSEGDRVDEDHHRLLLSFTETPNSHYFIAHGYPLALTTHTAAHSSSSSRMAEAAVQGSLRCHLSIVRAPLCGCPTSSVRAIHLTYTVCAPFPLFEPLQSVLSGDLLLFNTAESINVLHFGDLFEDRTHKEARHRFATAQVRGFPSLTLSTFPLIFAQLHLPFDAVQPTLLVPLSADCGGRGRGRTKDVRRNRWGFSSLSSFFMTLTSLTCQ